MREPDNFSIGYVILCSEALQHIVGTSKSLGFLFYPRHCQYAAANFCDSLTLQLSKTQAGFERFQQLFSLAPIPLVNISHTSRARECVCVWRRGYFVRLLGNNEGGSK